MGNKVTTMGKRSLMWKMRSLWVMRSVICVIRLSMYVRTMGNDVTNVDKVVIYLVITVGNKLAVLIK